MIDWELSVQYADGAFPGHYGEPGSKPVIFNTGQIIHGLLAGHLRLGRPECLAAAVRACVWLAKQQDPDGCWRSSQHNDIPHTYDTRASWAVLRTGLIAHEAKLQSVAVRQLDWALQQQDDGWFASNAFTLHAAPFTHTIGYAISGFLTSGLLLGDERYLFAARKAAQAIAKIQHMDGWLAGAYPDYVPGIIIAILCPPRLRGEPPRIAVAVTATGHISIRGQRAIRAALVRSAKLVLGEVPPKRSKEAGTPPMLPASS
jgi:hypothetical protein